MRGGAFRAGAALATVSFVAGRVAALAGVLLTVLVADRARCAAISKAFRSLAILIADKSGEG